MTQAKTIAIPPHIAFQKIGHVHDDTARTVAVDIATMKDMCVAQQIMSQPCPYLANTDCYKTFHPS